LAIACAVIFHPVLVDMLTSRDISIQYRAAQTFLILAKRLSPAALILFVLTFLHQLLISHRICGPIMNFTLTFKKIGQGDLTRKISLRRSDYLKREGRIINEMIDGLTVYIQRIKTDNDRLLSVLAEVTKTTAEQNGSPEVLEALAAIKREADLSKQDLAIFNYNPITSRAPSDN
jgi:methyl-accepting chemotaxis protein